MVSPLEGVGGCSILKTNYLIPLDVFCKACTNFYISRAFAKRARVICRFDANSTSLNHVRKILSTRSGSNLFHNHDDLGLDRSFHAGAIHYNLRRFFSILYRSQRINHLRLCDYAQPRSSSCSEYYRPFKRNY